MRTVIDQLGRTISIPDKPDRIVSIVPSQTELLSDLGLGAEVTGITKFCIHPEEWFRTKTRVGGTKQLDIELIRSLQPDLILANKEENERSQIELLEKEFPVWISDVRTFADAKHMVIAIGELTGRFFESVGLLNKIDTAFDFLDSFIKERKSYQAAYLIWNNPMMVAGGDTFISSMMATCGIKNIFQHHSRYPQVSDEQIRLAMPDFIFLSSEPFPFNEKHAADFRRRFPGSRVLCVDGELFSWYGSRLQHAPAYFRNLLEQIETLL